MNKHSAASWLRDLLAATKRANELRAELVQLDHRMACLRASIEDRDDAIRAMKAGLCVSLDFGVARDQEVEKLVRLDGVIYRLKVPRKGGYVDLEFNIHHPPISKVIDL